MQKYAKAIVLSFALLLVYGCASSSLNSTKKQMKSKSQYQSKLTPGDRDTRLAKATARLAERKPMAALRDIEKVLQQNDHDSQGLSELGVTLDMGGMHQQAQMCYRRGLFFNKKDVSIANNYAVSMMLSGNFDGAIKQFEWALKNDPKQQQLINNLKLAKKLENKVVMNSGWLDKSKAMIVANKHFHMPRYSLLANKDHTRLVVNRYCNPFTIAISTPSKKEALIAKSAKQLTAQIVKILGTQQALVKPITIKSKNQFAEQKIVVTQAKPSVTDVTPQAVSQPKTADATPPVMDNLIARDQVIDDFDRAFYEAAAVPKRKLSKRTVSARNKQSASRTFSKDEKQILKADGKNYTLILVSNTDQNAIKRVIKQSPKLPSLKLHSSKVKDVKTYYLSYGNYRSADAANTALFGLPIEWQKWVPNVKQYKEVQQHIKQ